MVATKVATENSNCASFVLVSEIACEGLLVFGRKKAHKHKLFALVNVQMALGQTAGCPGVNRAKKFMCSPRKTGNMNFSLWLTGGCPRVVPTFKKFMCSKFMCLFLTLWCRKSSSVVAGDCNLRLPGALRLSGIVSIFSGFSVENPTKKATGLKGVLNQKPKRSHKAKKSHEQHQRIF